MPKDERQIEQLAEIREHLESLEVLNQKIANKEFPTNEGTEILLKKLIDEVKEPATIKITLDVK